MKALQIQSQTLKGAGGTSPTKTRSARGMGEPEILSQPILLATLHSLLSSLWSPFWMRETLRSFPYEV